MAVRMALYTQAGIVIFGIAQANDSPGDEVRPMEGTDPRPADSTLTLQPAGHTDVLVASRLQSVFLGGSVEVYPAEPGPLNQGHRSLNRL